MISPIRTSRIVRRAFFIGARFFRGGAGFCGDFDKAPTPPKLFGSGGCLDIVGCFCLDLKFRARIGVVCALTVESADSSQGPPRP